MVTNEILNIGLDRGYKKKSKSEIFVNVYNYQGVIIWVHEVGKMVGGHFKISVYLGSFFLCSFN